jgi:transglutaminase-like putative cysteine protease
MMPKELKEYLQKDPPVNPDLPFWGLVALASSAVLYALQLNFYILAFILPVIILLSLKIRWRFRMQVHFEILIALVFFVVLFISGRLFATLQNYSIHRVADYLFYVMALVLFILMVIKTYKMKSRYEFYVAYLYSLMMIFISTFSVRTLDLENIILFSIYAIASNFCFIEMLPLSYKKVETPSKVSVLKNPIVLICIPLIVILSFLFGAFMKKHESAILRKLLEQGNQQATGSFAETCQLGTIENLPQPKFVAMRIHTKKNPVRVTGKIYNRYKSGTWEITSKIAPVNHLELPESNKYSNLIEDKNSVLFSLFSDRNTLSGRIDETGSQKYMVYVKRNRLVYYPDNAGILSARNNEFSIDNLGNITAISKDIENYELLPLNAPGGTVALITDPPTGEDYEIPADIKDKIRDLTLEVTKNRKNNPEKILAIVDYLQNNYPYKKGITLEKRMDPVLEFLMYKKAAHCEYFASGMTLMLRSIGIPGRYAVGYIVHEYKSLGGYYVVRGKDAHAWVLAWIPGKGWMVFDPTPPSGVPSGDESGTDDWFDYLSSRIEIMVLYIKNGDWKELANEAASLASLLVKNPTVIITEVLIILAVFIFIYRKKFAALLHSFRKKKDSAITDENPQAAHIISLLSRFDKLLERKNMIRPPNLTLVEFCGYLDDKNLEDNILQACRAFLELYSYIRYAGVEINENLIMELNNRFTLAETALLSINNRK